MGLGGLGSVVLGVGHKQGQLAKYFTCKLIGWLFQNESCDETNADETVSYCRYCRNRCDLRLMRWSDYSLSKVFQAGVAAAERKDQEGIAAAVSQLKGPGNSNRIATCCWACPIGNAERSKKLSLTLALPLVTPIPPHELWFARPHLYGRRRSCQRSADVKRSTGSRSKVCRCPSFLGRYLLRCRRDGARAAAYRESGRVGSR